MTSATFASSLRALYLRNNDANSKSLAPLGRGAERFEALETLMVSSNALTPKSIEVLSAATLLEGLRALYLDGNRLGDEGVKKLLKLNDLSGLRKLVLSNNDIGARGVRALAKCEQLCGLEAFELDPHTLSRAALKILACSPHLRELMRVNRRDPLIDEMTLNP